MELLTLGLIIEWLTGIIATKYFEGRYLETKGDDDAVNYTPVCIRRKFYYIVSEERFNSMRKELQIIRRR